MPQVWRFPHGPRGPTRPVRGCLQCGEQVYGLEEPRQLPARTQAEDRVMGYCMKCHESRQMLDPMVLVSDKGTRFLTGSCTECGVHMQVITGGIGGREPIKAHRDRLAAAKSYKPLRAILEQYQSRAS